MSLGGCGTWTLAASVRRGDTPGPGCWSCAGGRWKGIRAGAWERWPLCFRSRLCLLSCPTGRGQIALTGAGEGSLWDRASVACCCGCNPFILGTLGASGWVSFITGLQRTGAGISWKRNGRIWAKRLPCAFVPRTGRPVKVGGRAKRLPYVCPNGIESRGPLGETLTPFHCGGIWSLLEKGQF